MNDLKKLAAEREEARRDKADLFDFYHKNWDKLVEELRQLQMEQMARDFEPWERFRD